MKTITKELQRTNMSLLSLFCAANLDPKRIQIADLDLSECFLTLYLEDAQDIKATLDETLMFKLPVSKFAEIISAEGFNSYEGTRFSESGRAYTDRIVIAESIQWFKQDATPEEQQRVLESVKAIILKSSTRL
ncbi:hypothetical protein [Mucilaginibacter endophyticus]|uniref:hypothetical protein n=1 Tax=Mucilaginibacter endophyticus TaxID=2675003 RepID=UPI000E0D3E48|nr:hypothetical protein [Mucilaginibacter endophyticus]